MTFTLDAGLVKTVRKLGINISSSTRQGVSGAVHSALANIDREAYLRQPKSADSFWVEADSNWQ
jgi:post-segregation antitoxin (ccd killing protein)